MTKWFGDDIAAKSDKYAHELRGLRAAVSGMRLIGAGNPPLHRFRVGLEFILGGYRVFDGAIANHARLAALLAEQLRVPDVASAAIRTSYEQWDGKGWPGELKGEGIPIVSRVVQLAEFTEVAHRLGGVDAAKALASKRAGRQFDPNIAALVCANAEAIYAGVNETQTWKAVIDSEPALAVHLTPEEFDVALGAVANFIDLKSPYMLGHASAVADLLVAAANHLNWSADDVALVRRAGFVYSFGRLGVSNTIWDKPGPLGAGEWERVRMYPYITERILQQSRALAPLGAIAVQHRERLDGSGYPRGLSGGAISRPARLLAAADAYQAMRELRPHRPALSAEQAATELRAEVTARRMDGEAVDAVLASAGHRVPKRREGPAGLTTREVEVLRLLARGLSNKEIAQQLVITPKTASNHIEHIYTKIDATNRAGASMFAMSHGLLPEEEILTPAHR
jgi:HD-GYP domain-containing protein (c-di-GMP phosphodiesterase class II)